MSRRAMEGGREGGEAGEGGEWMEQQHSAQTPEGELERQPLWAGRESKRERGKGGRKSPFHLKITLSHTSLSLSAGGSNTHGGRSRVDQELPTLDLWSVFVAVQLEKNSVSRLERLRNRNRHIQTRTKWGNCSEAQELLKGKSWINLVYICEDQIKWVSWINRTSLHMIVRRTCYEVSAIRSLHQMCLLCMKVIYGLWGAATTWTCVWLSHMWGNDAPTR